MSGPENAGAKSLGDIDAAAVQDASSSMEEDGGMAFATTERARLAELEQIVEHGLQTFYDVGRALLEIRDGRLYRETHPTFEAYCAQRWSMSRPAAYRALDAASVADALSPNGDVPANEAQARELAPLKDGEAAIVEAWREAQAAAETHGKKLTAQTVRNAVRKRVKRIEREEAAKASSERVYTCDGCGLGGQPLDGWRFIRTPDGTNLDLCPECARRRSEAEQHERETMWASLSEEERHARLEAKADADVGRKLKGSLRWLCESEIAGYLRDELDALRQIEAWRHPEVLAALAVEAAAIEVAAREFAKWADGDGHDEAQP